jgi:carboxypeptidase T
MMKNIFNTTLRRKRSPRHYLRGVFIFCFLFVAGLSAPGQQYSKLKIFLDHRSLTEVIQMGLDIDHGIFEKPGVYISEFSSYDIAILQANSIRYEILIDDVVKHFHEENEKTTIEAEKTNASGCGVGFPGLKVPSHWHLGSMGGYFTYAQMLQMLDSMALEYPNLITIKKPASSTLNTVEGRPVYYVKISDNPNTDDPAESKILYTSLHHAREPLGMSQLIMFMYYVLENYTSDPLIKSIVDNTELYFIPCVNPDGYLYNQSTSPNGGGMWRKNRVQNADLTYGVDLNRNYGKFWGYDNTGSSNNGASETYRGPSAFSEPETRIIKAFCESYPFRIALNYHTFGNHIIYPWGYGNVLTPDSLTFKTFADYISKESKYRYGTCFETLYYVANGSSDDWMYGEQTTKGKTFAYTPECGSSFWMPMSQITATCRNLILQNIKAATLIMNTAVVTDINPKVISAATGYLKFDIRKIGLQNNDTFTVKMISLSAALTSSASQKEFTGMAMLQTLTDSFSYTINPGLVTDKKVKYILQWSNGKFALNDTIEKIFIDSVIPVYANNGSAISGWSNSGSSSWGLSAKHFVSPPSSIHDSPAGNYDNLGDYALTSTGTIDLTNSSFACLQYYARWDIERDYDYAQVAASEAGTNNWIPLCGLYTIPGGAGQDPGNPIYDAAQSSWVNEYIDLGDWLGKKIELRFSLYSDMYTNRDGFYIDDVSVLKKPNTISAGIAKTSSIQFDISPNPAKNQLRVTYANAGTDVLYEIKDIEGRVLNSFLCLDATAILDISTLAQGIYFLTARSGTEICTKKFVVHPN